MMTRPLALAGTLLVVFALSGGSAEPPGSPLAVRIVPSRHNEKGGRTIELFSPSSHFSVVVTNVSDRPVRLWREWCSWGYFNLSFVVTGEDGRPFTVERKSRGWDKNYPDPILVSPGDHLVWDVTFEESTWRDAPLPKRGQSRTVTMKAVYAIGADDQAKEFEVWTGRASSPADVYTLR